MFLKTLIWYFLDYQLTAWRPDVGGQFGLWIGLSAITVCELLELIVTIFELCVKKIRAGNKVHDGRAQPGNVLGIDKSLLVQIFVQPIDNLYLNFFKRVYFLFILFYFYRPFIGGVVKLEVQLKLESKLDV